MNEIENNRVLQVDSSEHYKSDEPLLMFFESTDNIQHRLNVVIVSYTHLTAQEHSSGQKKNKQSKGRKEGIRKRREE